MKYYLALIKAHVLSLTPRYWFTQVETFVGREGRAIRLVTIKEGKAIERAALYGSEETLKRARVMADEAHAMWERQRKRYTGA